MGLAEDRGPLRWSLNALLEPTLREMGQRGDIIATLAKATERAAPGRSRGDYRIADPAIMTPIVGRVTARGLVDEMAERRYLVVDGIDGRSHCVAIGDAEGAFPTDSIVRIAGASTEPRQADRTIAEVAAANGGRYTTDRHLLHDPNATERFADAHVRRLEAIRRATGGVEREPDGSWVIAPDHLDRVCADSACS